MFSMHLFITLDILRYHMGGSCYFRPFLSFFYFVKIRVAHLCYSYYNVIYIYSIDESVRFLLISETHIPLTISENPLQEDPLQEDLLESQ